MAKVVINGCYGGFGLSDKAVAEYERLSGQKLESQYSMDRGSVWLVQVVETLGAKANGPYSALKVVEIPDDVEWEIEEYDGSEWVAERHRTWS